MAKVVLILELVVTVSYCTNHIILVKRTRKVKTHDRKSLHFFMSDSKLLINRMFN